MNYFIKDNPSETKNEFTKAYIIPIILCSILFLLLSLITLFFQESLPLNPNNNNSINFKDALNLSISFITTTNLQISYAVSNLSYLSKLSLSLSAMVGSIIGISVAFLLIRSFNNLSNKTDIGNFYNDFINIGVLFFIPICMLISFIIIPFGTIQNFSPDIYFKSLEGIKKTIEGGPVASFVAIKIFGVNGGGFFASSSAHPFENPSEWTNLIQIICMLLIPSALLVCYGIKCYTLKHATLYLSIFYCLALLSSNIVKSFEISDLNTSVKKEGRFGIEGSSFYNTISVISSGSSNSSLKSYTDQSKLIFVSNILLGNPIFGGAGTGFSNFIAIVILTVFISGLMAGRSPVLYGKRIGVLEISYIVSYLLIIQTTIFSLTYLNAFYNGFDINIISEIFFNIVSAVNNNGSSISLAEDNGLLLNSTSAAMLLGRIAQLTVGIGIAHSLINKPQVFNKLYDIKINTLFFMMLLIFILLINFMIYLPYLILWPTLNILT